MAICDISLPIMDVCSLSYIQGDGLQQPHNRFCNDQKPKRSVNSLSTLRGATTIANHLQSPTMTSTTSDDNNCATTTTKKLWKRVRFAPSVHIPPVSSTKLTAPPIEINHLIKTKMWYQDLDYRSFRNDIKRGIATEQPFYCNRQCVAGQGRISCTPTLYTQSLHQIYASAGASTSDGLTSKTDTSFSRKVIESVIQREPSKRGYELYLMDGTRKAGKKYVSFIVRKQQDINNDPVLNDEMKVEALRWFSKKRTRASRYFAQAMGQVDAATAFATTK